MKHLKSMNKKARLLEQAASPEQREEVVAMQTVVGCTATTDPGWELDAFGGLGSLLLVLGEPLYDDPGYCQRHAGVATDGNCVHHGACSLRALWQTLEHWIRGSLDQVTLADLLQSEGRIAELVRQRLANPALLHSPLIPLTTI